MLGRNIRYAFRSLIRTPGVTIVAVVCLALGIGVNSTIFAVVDGVLIQPFPYADPENIVVLNQTHHRSGIREAGLSYLDVKDWREQNRHRGA